MIDTQVLLDVAVISALVILILGKHLKTGSMQTIVFTGVGSDFGGCFTINLFKPVSVDIFSKKSITNQISSWRI